MTERLLCLRSSAVRLASREQGVWGGEESRHALKTLCLYTYTVAGDGMILIKMTMWDLL